MPHIVRAQRHCRNSRVHSGIAANVIGDIVAYSGIAANVIGDIVANSSPSGIAANVIGGIVANSPHHSI